MRDEASPVHCDYNGSIIHSVTKNTHMDIPMLAHPVQDMVIRFNRREDSASRLKWPDIYRGIAIMAVVLIHATGHVLSQTSPCGWTWFGIAAVNRLLQFAVPAFLFISAFLNAGSLKRNRSITEYAARRFRSTVMPFILTSIIGLIFTYRHGIGNDSLQHIMKNILIGKAYYHLYFMTIVFQLYAVLPLLMRRWAHSKFVDVLLFPFPFREGWRGTSRGRFFMPRSTFLEHALRRSSFGFQLPSTFRQVCFLGIALQLGVYFLNRYGYQNTTLSSSLLWYILPVCLGLWLYLYPEQNVSALVIKLRFITVVLLLLLAVYLPISVLALLGPVNTLVYQIVNWGFTSIGALILVPISVSICTCKISGLLADIGKSSFLIYLAHPFIIFILDRLIPCVRLWPAAMSIIVYFIVPIVITMMTGGWWNRMKKTNHLLTSLFR